MNTGHCYLRTPSLNEQLGLLIEGHLHQVSIIHGTGKRILRRSRPPAMQLHEHEKLPQMTLIEPNLVIPLLTTGAHCSKDFRPEHRK